MPLPQQIGEFTVIFQIQSLTLELNSAAAINVSTVDPRKRMTFLQKRLSSQVYLAPKLTDLCIFGFWLHLYLCIQLLQLSWRVEANSGLQISSVTRFTSNHGKLQVNYDVEHHNRHRQPRSISVLTKIPGSFDKSTAFGHSPKHRVMRSQAENVVNSQSLAPIPSATANGASREVHSEYLGSLSDSILPADEREQLLRPEKCIPIEIPLCKNIGYNLTYMPNAFHHETQEEAGLEVHQFYPLVEINCSEDLRLFLCSMYTPICLPNWHYRLTACRSLCESARDGCMPVMQTYGFGWPERMNCDLLPEGNECVSRRNSTTSTKSSHSKSTDQNDVSNKDRLSPHDLSLSTDPRETQMLRKKLNTSSLVSTDLLSSVRDRMPRKLNEALTELFDKNGRLKHNRLSKNSEKEDEQQQQQYICPPCRCRDPYITSFKPPYNEVVTGGVVGCLPSCRNPAFSSKSDKTFATFWLGLWAVLCILSTLATVATFLADPTRFQYPERPIIYLSACYLMVALGYLIRVGMGHEAIACDGPRLRRGTTGPAQCSIVFLLTYVFAMASSVWWVVLTLTWFLAAGLKWGSEAIAKYSQIYHFLAWFVPGAQAILVLIMSAIDGDPVGGLCYVGSTSLTNLRLFVLAPMCIYLGLGTVFLVAGFVALFKIRSAIKLQARGHLKTDKLEKLMIRIGIFGVLYTVPAIVVIACICYELANREAWERNHNCPCLPIPKMGSLWHEDFIEKLNSMFQTTDYPVKLTDSGTSQNDNSLIRLKSKDDVFQQPEYAIFMLKYFMSLVVGITSGFWIWSSKTLDSWQSCLRRTTNKSCGGKSKRTQNSVVQALCPAGQVVTGRSPPPCSMAWNPGQPKLWMANTGKPMGVGNTPVGVNSCTTWQDDFAPSARLLPQPPQANLTCNHSLGVHLGLNGVGSGSSGSAVGGPGLSMPTMQANSGSFTAGQMDGTAISGGSGNNGQHSHPAVAAAATAAGQMEGGNVLMLSPTPMTHI
ncbi:unnamed protein product [Calicophoron daubneyi]|uniref:Frizzled 5/8 n=1 Tax=Calicophoron daubneyi TaxID=300641 RepID=A0AAV2TVT3_CALDB